MHFSIILAVATFGSLIPSISACLGDLHRRDTGGAHFSYLGLTGPVDWIQFDKICGDGQTQSPINVVSTMSISSGGDQGEYDNIGASGVNFINNGHTVQVNYQGQPAHLGGVDYVLQQFHFHTPAEHRLNNEWFPMEVHFVHQALHGLVVDPKKLAVVGIFIEISDDNTSDPMISGLSEFIQSIGEEGATVVATNIDLEGVRNAITNAPKFTYKGSLTTPPCTEGVSWFVSETVLDISIADYKAFKQVLGYNSRNLQDNPGEQNVVEFAAQYVGPSVHFPPIDIGLKKNKKKTKRFAA
ncbi:Nectarin-2 [Dactylellina cionopaga]|nr:Nectarin-2 [Dactylellina cionopaga]